LIEEREHLGNAAFDSRERAAARNSPAHVRS
jgi:hypothetical protein